MRVLRLAPLAACATYLFTVPLPAQSGSDAVSTPQALAPNLADSGRVFRGVLADGGRELWFFKRVGSSGENYRIFHSRRIGSSWSEPVQVALGDSTQSDLYPTLSTDGTRLVFSSYRPLPGPDSAAHNAHLWVAERTATGWSAPEPLVKVNRPGLYHPGVLFRPDGSLRFVLVDQGQRTSRVMTAAPEGRSFAAATPVADPAFWRSTQQEFVYHGAVLSPDGSLAVIGASRIDRAQRRVLPPDAFFSRWVNGAWTGLVPLAAGVNTERDENFFSFSPDGCALIFTRDYTAFYTVPVGAATGQAPKLCASGKNRE